MGGIFPLHLETYQLFSKGQVMILLEKLDSQGKGNNDEPKGDASYFPKKIKNIISKSKEEK